MNHDKKQEDELVAPAVEPTGVQRYEHDLFNLTDKEKARDILDDLMFDYLEKGGAIKKLETIK